MATAVAVAPRPLPERVGFPKLAAEVVMHLEVALPWGQAEEDAGEVEAVLTSHPGVDVGPGVPAGTAAAM